MELAGISEFDVCGSCTSVSESLVSELDGRPVKVLHKHHHTSEILNVDAIRQRMSKPDNFEGKVTIGYDEERGGRIEGSVSVSWGDSKESSSNKNDSGGDMPKKPEE